ncbi:MAG: S1C family serine protease [Gaiellaceae bacterium]
MTLVPQWRTTLLVLCLVVFGALVVRGSVAQAGTAAARDGIVLVTTRLAYQGGAAAGTGMVVTPTGRVVTNNHVIAGAASVSVTVPSTRRTYTAQVVGYDVVDDVALLQLRGAVNLATVTRGSSSSVAVGDPVTAVGNAGGTGSLSAAAGKVIGVGRSIRAGDDQGRSERLTGLIETNAHVRPGDSGGPLLDSGGRVVGMVTAASGPSFRFRGAPAASAFAIPVAKAFALAQKIASGRSSAAVHVGPTAFLGVQVTAVDAGSTAGALIAGVVRGAPAASAGIATGDVITALAGRRVASPSAVSSILLTKKPGMRVAVAYVDGAGSTHATSVTLASGPPQ